MKNFRKAKPFMGCLFHISILWLWGKMWGGIRAFSSFRLSRFQIWPGGWKESYAQPSEDICRGHMTFPRPRVVWELASASGVWWQPGLRGTCEDFEQTSSQLCSPLQLPATASSHFASFLPEDVGLMVLQLGTFQPYQRAGPMFVLCGFHIYLECESD